MAMGHDLQDQPVSAPRCKSRRSWSGIYTFLYAAKPVCNEPDGSSKCAHYVSSLSHTKSLFKTSKIEIDGGFGSYIPMSL